MIEMKFWEWMKEKRYGYIYLYDFNNLAFPVLIHIENDAVEKIRIDPPNQMLIGYMLEYIRDHEYWKNYNIFEGDILLGKLSMLWNCENHYLELKKIIKELYRE